MFHFIVSYEYVPWIFMLIDLFSGIPLLDEVKGILAGHIYYYFETVLRDDTIGGPDVGKWFMFDDSSYFFFIVLSSSLFHSLLAQSRTSSSQPIRNSLLSPSSQHPLLTSRLLQKRMIEPSLLPSLVNPVFYCVE